MYCIGLISGTSVDGIDAALVEIHGKATELNIQLIHGQTYPYSPQLREQILAVCHGRALSIEAFAELDDAIAQAFAQAAKAIQSDYPTADLIGSHGQTVFHRPPTHNLGYSLQLGRGEVIAQLTRIPTVSNFRVADIAASGQGAPLVSKVDAYLLSHPTKHRCVQNIGGIGNVTYLPPRQQENWEASIIGWDTGPGNVLVDLAIQKLTQGQQTYDNDGQWAAKGKPYQNLIHQWLEQDFFLQPPPKSTGRELFGQAYLQQCWQDAQTYQLSEADWLATLTDFTAASIVHSYQTYLKQMPGEVMVCGGGSHNSYLKERIQARLGQSVKLLTTDDLGLSSDFKEAIAFAILAYWRFCCGFPGNLPQVTGAKKAMLLGDIHLPI